MVKCPRCGAEVADPVKVWPMSQGPTSDGEILRQTVALYKCAMCGNSFRKFIGKEKININEIMEKNKALEEMVLEATKKRAELEEKIKALEDEKSSLQAEIAALKAIAELESKSSALEDEVAKLREEKKALEEATAGEQASAEQEQHEEAPETPAETPPPTEEPICTPADEQHEEKPCE